jgi:hypothetical protein
VAGAAPPGATAGTTRTRDAIVVGAVATGACDATVVVDRVEAAECTRRVIFFVGTAVEVEDAPVLGDETATPDAVPEREPPQATVNAINAPTTAPVRKRGDKRRFTGRSVTRNPMARTCPGARPACTVHAEVVQSDQP